MAALHRAIAALPADLRICWVLREVEGQGYSEIAEITATPEATS